MGLVWRCRGIDDSPLLFGFRACHGVNGASMLIDEVNVEVPQAVLGGGDVQGECGRVLVGWVWTEDERQLRRRCAIAMSPLGGLFFSTATPRGGNWASWGVV